jgi:hypothetical protein
MVGSAIFSGTLNTDGIVGTEGFGGTLNTDGCVGVAVEADEERLVGINGGIDNKKAWACQCEGRGMLP